MFVYFSLPTSTTDIVGAVNTIFSSWGGGALNDLATIVLGALFAIIILGYVLRHIRK